MHRSESWCRRSDAEDVIGQPTRGTGAPRVTQAGEALGAAKDGIVGLQAIAPLGSEAFPECRCTEAQHSSPAAIEERGSCTPAARSRHALEHEIAVEW